LICRGTAPKKTLASLSYFVVNGEWEIAYTGPELKEQMIEEIKNRQKQKE
jgi:hypothetical protein